MRLRTLVWVTAIPTLGLAGSAVAAPAKVRVERVSVGSAEEEVNAESFGPFISGDGRYVVFTSLASNIDGPDSENSPDVFVRDTQQGSTVRITRSAHGSVIDMSSDGRYLLLGTEAGIQLYDAATSTQERIDVSTTGEVANGPGTYGAVSDDGRYVAFGSGATNLVDGDANGAGGDTFLRDRVSGTTTRISPNESDGYCPRNRVSMSSDGRYTTFACYRPFSEPLFVFDRVLGVRSEVSDDAAEPSMSDDGRYIAFMSGTQITSTDDNGYDVFLLDRGTGGIVPLSVTGGGAAGNRTSQDPSISGDGRYVVFRSGASDLVARDTNGTEDIFVRDVTTGELILVQFRMTGKDVSPGGNPTLSGTGRYLAFTSWADSLVKGDTNGTSDVFKAELG
jgi:Tol biopolymer transport system component